MHITEELCQLLLCPQSQGPIVNKDGRYFSPQANVKYDNYEGIPWIFKHPQVHLFQWQQHIKNFLVSIEENLEFIDSQMALSLGGQKTKDRLALLRKGLRHNCEALVSLLTSFVEQSEVPRPDYKKLNFDRLPPTQHLNSYFHTLFRDWSWENGENTKAHQIVAPLVPNSTENLLILGSGASRLAFDIHQSHVNGQTVALDINPLLLMSAKKIIFDNPIDLYELPVAPIHLKDSCVKSTLKRPKDTKPGFHLVFGDGLNPPFKKSSFSAVLTPWFIDIIPMDLRLFARRVNSLLQTGGSWINFGPLGYQQAFEAKSYSLEEIQDIFDEAGFNVKNHSVEEVEYLASPHSSQSRKEQVVVFSVEKTTNVENPPYFSYFPSWITNESAPIPRLPQLDHVQIQNKTYSELINCIDGSRTQNDIIPLMIKHYGMEEDVAREALAAVLINIFEGRV